MVGKKLASLFALCLAAVPAEATAQSADDVLQNSIAQSGSETGGQSYGDRNKGGPYGFYSYPRHFHIDRGSSRLDRAPSSVMSSGSSASYDRNYGSAYYGRDYGAPYYGGGYYDGGTYYRERRD